MKPELIRNFSLIIPTLLLSFSVHEYAHAWAATRLGDGTPRAQGRLTLSPLAHIDWLGTLVFPFILFMTTGGLFGWAKPVQFNPANFTRRFSMRVAAALVALAGPVSNLILAFLTLVLVRVLLSTGVVESGSGFVPMLLEFSRYMVMLNILLAVFNLLPLPPLDGSYLLPRSLDNAKAWLAQYSFIIFIGLFFIPIPGVGTIGGFVIGPAMSTVQQLLQRVAFYGL